MRWLDARLLENTWFKITTVIVLTFQNLKSLLGGSYQLLSWNRAAKDFFFKCPGSLDR